MTISSENRAVTALFRAFGGSGSQMPAEARQDTEIVPMHEAERTFLAIWMPLAVMVAVADGLHLWLGWIAAILISLPLSILAINVLPFGIGARSASMQWRLWLGIGLLWSLFHFADDDLSGWAAIGWISLGVLNLCATIALALRRSLGASGQSGLTRRMILLGMLHLVILCLFLFAGWLWGLVSGALLHGSLCWMILRPSSQWLGPVKCRTGDRSILVTIDDGPDPKNTPKILDLLDQHQVKAVFFMIGEKVAQYPELAREVLRRGHEIGNHTTTHPQGSFWCAGPWRTQWEITECQRTIEEVTGVKPRYFRAPVGHRNLFTHPVTQGLGLEVMAWSRRGYDAVSSRPDEVVSRILKGLGHGDIVLAHEATPISGKVMEGVLEGVRRVSLSD